MPTHPTLTLIRKVHEGGNVWSFIFEPSTPLTWTAGQFVRVELPHDQPDDEGTRRSFTVTSAPHEGVVQIATRVTSSTFKQALAALPNGGQLHLLDMPAGDFLWPNTATRPVLFAAQGIGITPFISMLRDRVRNEHPLTATVLHANPGGEAPFQPELDRLAHGHPEFTLIRATEPLTADTIIRLYPEFASRTVYVSGPRLLFGLLKPPHNLPISQLKQDQFPNYTASSY